MRYFFKLKFIKVLNIDVQFAAKDVLVTIQFQQKELGVQWI